ncbi:MAG: serine--tRNA ligase, partial [Mariprofundaceae bacterium]
MIDRQALRRDFDAMQAALARRGDDVVGAGSAWAQLVELDARQRELKTESENLQAERNRVSKLIGRKKGQGEDASAEMAAMGEVSRKVKELDALARDAEAAFAEALLEIPNPLHESVPDGASEDD